MMSIFPSDPFDSSSNWKNNNLINEYNNCTTIYSIIIPTYDYIIISSILYALLDEIYRIITIILTVKYNYWILYKRYNKVPQNLLNSSLYSSSRLSQTSTSSLELGVINHNHHHQNSPKVYPITSISDIDFTIDNNNYNNNNNDNNNNNGDHFTDVEVRSSILREVLEEYKYNQINFYLSQQLICSFFIILYSLSTIDYGTNNWITYIKFYGFIVHSSVTGLFISSIWEMYVIRQQKLSNSNDPRSFNHHGILIAKIAVSLSSLFLLPIIITHIIPMFIVYIWVVFCYGLIILLIGVCFTCVHVFVGYVVGFFLILLVKYILYLSSIKIDTTSSYFEEFQESIIKTWFYRIFLHFTIQLMFSVLYNYGSLLYTTSNLDESKYFGIIGVDYTNHTQLSCFYTYSYDISFKGLLVFIQFII